MNTIKNLQDKTTLPVEIHTKHQEETKVPCANICGAPQVFRAILCQASENLPKNLILFRLVNKEWKLHTDKLFNQLWFRIKDWANLGEGHIQILINKVEKRYRFENCNSAFSTGLLAIEKCKKLQNDLLSVYEEKKLREMPLTLENYRALQQEQEDRTLKVIWQKAICETFEKQLDQYNHLDKVFLGSILNDYYATAETIRKCLFRNPDRLAKIDKLKMENLELDFIPKELEFFPNLKKLSMCNNKIANIANLSKLTKLECLYLGTNNITEITNVSNLQQLTQLDISKNLIEHVENLDKQTKLRGLFLQFNRIVEIEKGKLKPLENLEVLSLANNCISNTKSLSELTKLTALDLSHNYIKDLDEEMSKLKNLTMLRLSKNRIVDPKNVCKLKHLAQLNLTENQIRDFENVSEMQSLTHLDLSKNRIINIEKLTKQLTQLKELIINNNLINTTGDVSKLQQLIRLNVSHNNRILKICNLDRLTNLTELDLRGNGQINPLWKNATINILRTYKLSHSDGVNLPPNQDQMMPPEQLLEWRQQQLSLTHGFLFGGGLPPAPIIIPYPPLVGQQQVERQVNNDNNKRKREEPED